MQDQIIRHKIVPKKKSKIYFDPELSRAERWFVEAEFGDPKKALLKNLIHKETPATVKIKKGVSSSLLAVIKAEIKKKLFPKSSLEEVKKNYPKTGKARKKIAEKKKSDEDRKAFQEKKRKSNNEEHF